MCGRYSLESSAKEIVEAFELADSIAFAPRYNIAPTQKTPIVRMDRRTHERRAASRAPRRGARRGLDRHERRALQAARRGDPGRGAAVALKGLRSLRKLRSVGAPVLDFRP